MRCKSQLKLEETERREADAPALLEGDLDELVDELSGSLSSLKPSSVSGDLT